MVHILPRMQKLFDMKRQFITLSAFFLSILLLGCEKDNSSDDGLTISLTMSQPGSAGAVNPPSSSVVSFSSGYVVVREVVFDGDRNDGRSVSITEEKITTIDIRTGTANPPFLMDIPAGTYTSVNLGIEIQDETSRPSVVAEGSYTNGNGQVVPVRFEFNSGEVFEANANTAVTLSQNTPATAKISFDPHVWFSTITRTQLDNAVRTNGVVVISETSNAGLFSIVADRLDNATQAVFR
jgi:hypothetical protein